MQAADGVPIKKSDPIDIPQRTSKPRPKCELCGMDIYGMSVSLYTTSLKDVHFDCYAKWRGRDVKKYPNISD